MVADSTPLITLLKAERLDVLHGLFGDVLIPEAVLLEVTSNDSFENEARIVRSSDFVRVVRVSDRNAVRLLQRATGLDRGESEAIVYADEVGADLLLMDEVAGRRVARNMGIPMSGSVGVLVKAFKAGLITSGEADEAFARIRAAGRNISEQLICSALGIIHGE